MYLVPPFSLKGLKIQFKLLISQGSMLYVGDTVNDSQRRAFLRHKLADLGWEEQNWLLGSWQGL